MNLGDMNWLEVQEYLVKEDRILIVLGATEQHGYLSVTTDVSIPLALANSASEATGVVVAPPMNFGISPYFLEYPGTISLRASTFLDVVEDILRSLHHQGFRHFLILNGHGGNDAARGRIVELENELKRMKVAWYSWWMEPSVTAVAEKHGLVSHHAAWIEAFPFIHSRGIPEGSKDTLTPKTLMSAKEVREYAGDGVYGGPYKVADGIMDEIYAAALKDILELLKFENPPMHLI